MFLIFSSSSVSASRGFIQDGSCGILGIRDSAQKHHRLVCFAPVRQHVAQSGSPSQADRENSLRRRVQSPCVADFFCFKIPLSFATTSWEV